MISSKPSAHRLSSGWAIESFAAECGVVIGVWYIEEDPAAGSD